MFDIISGKLNSNEIDYFLDRKSLNINVKTYMLMLNDKVEGDVFRYVENSSIGYQGEYHLNDIMKYITNNKPFTLVGYGYDSLSMSEKSVNVEPVNLNESKCSIVYDATLDDLCDNIPLYRDILLIDVNKIKQIDHKKENSNLYVIKQLNEFIKYGTDDLMVIYRKDKVLYYIYK